MGKQKIVMRVAMEDAKRRSKALKIVVGLPGVISAALEGEERDRIVVVGEGVDSVKLTIMLRRQMGLAELVSVAAVDEKKKEEEKKTEGGEGKSVQPVYWPYHGSMAQPYVYEIRDNNNNYDPSCCIM